jgi:hypothetical protein
MTLHVSVRSISAVLLLCVGSVRFPQSGMQGRFSSSSAGDDRLRTDLDVDGSVQIRTVLNKGRASKAVGGGLSTELTGKQLAQIRLGAALLGDWRKYYDAIRVVRTGVLGGRKVYGVQLEPAGLPPALVAVDAETGDVLETRQTMWSAEAGAAVAIPVTTTYSDYREVGGMRVPHRYITSSDMTGRAIFQVERVEVGVKFAADTFALEPSAASSRERLGGAR